MRKLFNSFSLLATAAVLAACSGSLTADPPGRLDQAGTASLVEITSADTRESVESRLSGSVVVWRPEAGFAVVRSAEVPSGVRAQGVQSEPNNGAVALPGLAERPGGADEGVSAQGWKIWSGGWKIWSGGWKIWSGGWKIWSGDAGDSLAELEGQAAWNRIGLRSALDTAIHDGSGVTIAVIDTGIDDQHPVFEGNLARNAWRDFVGDGDDHPAEEGAEGDPGYGHGTAVAAIALQLAPNATILPLRVLGPDGSGDVADAAEAIAHAIDAGADIINLSFGAKTYSPTLVRMIELAAENGVYVVSASGNSGDQRILSPASSSTHRLLVGHMSLGVGSVDDADRKTEYSTYGKQLELLAPGALATAVPGRRLATMQGTSASTAVVTGALALGLGEAGATGNHLAELLGETAVDIDALNPDYAGKLGHGRIDVAAFLEALGN